MADEMMDFAELREWLQESAKEFDRRSAKIDRQFEETSRQFEEIGQKFEETSRLIEKNSQQIEKNSQQIEKNSQQIEENGQQIKALRELYTTQWGRLIEALVEPGSVKLFTDRGIDVRMVFPRIHGKKNGRHFEIDLLLANTSEIVVIEVKTTLKVDDIDHFCRKLDTITDFFPVYKEFKVYGAVAGVQINEGIGEYAYRRGLFVLGLGREGLVRILNDAKFAPTDFNEKT